MSANWHLTSPSSTLVIKVKEFQNHINVFSTFTQTFLSSNNLFNLFLKFHILKLFSFPTASLIGMLFFLKKKIIEGIPQMFKIV